jgi:nucleotide-binding universal stress UspA family protein
VLTLRPPQHDFVEHRGSHSELRLNRVLLCTNFRPSSAAATRVARELAHQNGAELHIVYVIGDYFDQLSVMFPEGALSALSRLREYIKESMAQLKRSEGTEAQTHVAEGRPYEKIAQLAESIDADLIVIGTSVHASLFGGAPSLGSEIERVVRNAPCPVLCVPVTKVLTPLPALVTQPAG